MLGAVIFDFDGVITDSEILHFRSFNMALARHGVQMSKRDYYKDYLGLTDADFFKTMVEKNLLQVNKQGFEKLMQDKRATFERLARTEGKIIEGVREFVQMLKQHGIPMAICSGALLPEIELILEEAKLRSFFNVIVSAEQVKKGKPNPEGFLLTLKKLNKGRSTTISAEQCIAIEDSHWGLDAAKAAGMHTLAITNSYDAEQLAMSEKIVARLDQLSMSDLESLCND